jgi:FMN phosphatase YigB (HAD superfamily)
MSDIAAAGLTQGLLSDGQSFTLIQALRSLAMQDDLPPVYELFRPQTLVLSYDVGVRKPSKTLFAEAVQQLRSVGIQAQETLHISCRLSTDLVPARAAGMKTALLVAEKSGLEVSADVLKAPETRPDRLLTDLSQLRSVLGI